jgi:hypothetical protein
LRSGSIVENTGSAGKSWTSPQYRAKIMLLRRNLPTSDCVESRLGPSNAGAATASNNFLFGQ